AIIGRGFVFDNLGENYYTQRGCEFKRTPILQALIRNFSIIAHIDHGKSTLADRLLEYTGAISARESREQILDAMDLERERGITIKANTVTIRHKADDGNEYLLNLIDTPGHVDFTYEVSRSLAACEGAVLLVDASQGVEAQTIANAHLAIENHLTVIPVINKVDLASADIEGTKRQIEDVLGLDAHDAVLTSAKAGSGTKDVLEAVVKRIPPPSGDPDRPLRALVFDSWFDNYQGVTVLARVGDGAIEPAMKVRMTGSGKVFEVQEVGISTPKRVKTERLEREYGLELISTTPTVVYRVTTTKGTVLYIDNPTKLPEPNHIERFEEPFIKATLITPEAYVGNLLALCQERRGTQKGLTYL